MLRSASSGVLVLALASGVVHGQGASPSPADLLKDPSVKAAVDAAKATEAQTIADQIRFCEIPAPSFKEDARGQELKRVFTQLGLRNVRVDKIGNVLGDYPGGAAPHPHLVLGLAAFHPFGVRIRVRVRVCVRVLISWCCCCCRVWSTGARRVSSMLLPSWVRIPAEFGSGCLPESDENFFGFLKDVQLETSSGLHLM